MYNLIYIVSCRMELQKCRNKGWEHRVGFMLPILINQKNLLDDYQQTCTNMYQALMQQYYKPYIFIPYNYE
jgi:hypothetical protein